MRRTVTVEVPGHSYDVVIGPGVVRDLGALVGERRRVAVVSQAPVADRHRGSVLEVLPGGELFLIADGEGAKTLATVDHLCRRFAAWGLLRDDAVVALGGGVVGDVAGFAAALYHRGVDVVHAPTTFLAQVDASIGGKTGVNLPEGKNLVGAFHQPLGVVCDTSTLVTLPEREYRAGLGEVAKYALLDRSGELAGVLLDGAAAVLLRDPATLTDLVTRCVAMKAEVVADDPEERTGRRAVLNYGHTLAHAIETARGYEQLHGEAVGVGLVFAGELAGALQRIDRTEVDRHREPVQALGLPVTVPDGVPAAELLTLMRRDKKTSGGLTFVLPGRNGVERVDDPPPHAVERALAAVGVRS